MTITMLPELAQGNTRVAREIQRGQASAELIDALLNQTRLVTVQRFIFPAQLPSGRFRKMSA